MAETIGTILIDVQANTQKLVAGMDKAEKLVGNSVKTLKSSLLGLTATYLTLNGASDLSKTFLRNADAMTNVNSKLKLVTKSSEELLTVNDKLYNMSQLTRTSMLSNVDLYQKMATSTKSLNLSQEEMLSLTETVSKSMIVSGTSVEGATALVTQLGQAFSSDFKGVAQELGTIRDQSMSLYNAILSGLNMTSDQFRKAAKDGDLSSKMIIESLQAQKNAMDESFKLMVMTYEGSVQKITNATQRLSGQIDNTFGITKKLSETISGLSKDIDSLEITSDTIQTFENLGKSILAVGAAYITTKKSIAIYSAITQVTKDRNDLLIKSETAKSKAHSLARRSIEKQNKAIEGANTLKQTQINKLNKESVALNQASKKQALYATSLNKTAKTTNIATIATRNLSTALKTIAPFAIASGFIAIADSLFTANSNADTLNDTLTSTVDNLKKLTNNQLEYRKALLLTEISEQRLEKIALGKQVDRIGKKLFGVNIGTKEGSLEALKLRADYEEAKKEGIKLNEVLKNIRKAQNEINTPSFTITKTKPKEKTTVTATDTEVNTTSLSDWQDYYKSIGDLDTAWLFQEVENKKKWIDLTTDQFKQANDIAKAEFFEKFDNEIDLSINFDGWNDFSDGIAGALNGIQDISKSTKEYNEVLSNQKSTQKDIDKATSKYATSQIGNIANITNSMANFYDEDDDRRKKQQKLAQVFQAAQMAMQISQMAQSTAFTSLFVAQETVKSQAAGTTAVMVAAQSSPWTGFATAAAMAAMVASFGVMLSGSGSAQDTYLVQQNPNSTTVFGGGDNESTSLKNSLDTLESFAKPQFRELSKMADYLENIDKNIAGVSADVIRTGGFALGVGGVNSTSSYQNQALNGNVAGIAGGAGILAGAGIYGGVGATGGLSLMGPYALGALAIDKVLNLGITDALGGVVNSVLGSFGLGGGGYNWQQLSGSGIAFGNGATSGTYSATEGYYGGTSSQQSFTPQTLENLISDFAGSLFQTQSFESMSKSFWGSASYSYWSTTTYKELDQELANSLSRTFENIRDSIVLSSDILNEDVTDSLNKMVVNIGQIDLKGLSGDAIVEKLQSAFSAQSDKFVDALYGEELDNFQGIGEGLYETLIRVSTGISEAEYYTNRLGNLYDTINFKDIIDTKGDVGFEALAQSIIKADEAIYGLDNGVVKMIDSMNASAEDLFDTYNTLEDIRDNLSLTGQDAANLSSSFFLGAGGVEELSDSLDSFFENFLTESEQITALTSRLNKEFGTLGIAAPNSIEEFKNLVQGIDTTTDSGAELYGRVILLSDSFSEVYGTADKANNLFLELSKTFLNLSDSVENTINTLLGGSDDVNANSVLIDTYLKKEQELNNLLALDTKTLTDTQKEKISDLVGDVNQLATNIQSSTFGDNANITNELIGSLSQIEKGLDFGSEILNVKIVGFDSEIMTINTDVIAIAPPTANASIPTLSIPQSNINQNSDKITSLLEDIKSILGSNPSDTLDILEGIATGQYTLQVNQI